MQELTQMVMTFDEVSENFAEDATNGNADGMQIPDYKGTIPTPKGYFTIRRKFAIDPARYRSPNYVPLVEGQDPKDVQMPNGIVGMEEVLEETMSEVGEGDASKGEDARQQTAQDAMYSALMGTSVIAPIAAVVEDESADSLLCNMCMPDTTFVEDADSPCVAMDAKTPRKPKVPCKTKYKDCRAKNPLYCPYHGAALIKDDIVRQLHSMGVNGLVEVESGEDTGEFFYLAVTVPEADKQKAEGIIDALMKTPGFKQTVDTDKQSVGSGMTELSAYFNVDVLRANVPPFQQDKGNRDERKETEEDKNKGEEEEGKGENEEEGHPKQEDKGEKKDEDEEKKDEDTPPPPPPPDEEDNRDNEGEGKKEDESDKKDEDTNPPPPPPPPPPDKDEKQEETDKEIAGMRKAIDDILSDISKCDVAITNARENAPDRNFDDISQKTGEFRERMLNLSDSFKEMVEKRNEAMKSNGDSVQMALNAHVLDMMIKSFKEKSIPRAQEELQNIEQEVSELSAQAQQDKENKAIDYAKDSIDKSISAMENEVFGDVAEKGIPIPSGLMFKPLGLEAGLITMLSDAEKYNGSDEDTKRVASALYLDATMDRYHDAVGAYYTALDEAEKMEGMPSSEIEKKKDEILGAILDYKIAAAMLKEGYVKAADALRNAKDRRDALRKEEEEKNKHMSMPTDKMLADETMLADDLLAQLKLSTAEAIAQKDGAERYRLRSDLTEGLFADIDADKDGKIKSLAITLPNRATMNFNSVEAFKNVHARLFGYDRFDRNASVFDGVPIEDVLKSEAIRSLLPSPSEIEMEEKDGSLAEKTTKADAFREVAKQKRAVWRWHKSTGTREDAKKGFTEANETGMQLAEAALSWFGMHEKRNHEVTIKDVSAPKKSDVGTSMSGIENLQRLLPRMMPSSVKGEIGMEKGKAGARAFCSWSNVIHPATFETLDVFVHEAGHSFEFLDPHVKDRCVEFLRYRTRGEELHTLRHLTGSSAYSADERAMKDKFYDVYCGKYYPQYKYTTTAGKTVFTSYNRNAKRKLDTAMLDGSISDYSLTSRCTEVLSMGVQRMITHPIEFVKEDPEYAAFVLGICQGAI